MDLDDITVDLPEIPDSIFQAILAALKLDLSETGEQQQLPTETVSTQSTNSDNSPASSNIEGAAHSIQPSSSIPTNLPEPFSAIPTSTTSGSFMLRSLLSQWRPPRDPVRQFYARMRYRNERRLLRQFQRESFTSTKNTLSRLQLHEQFQMTRFQAPPNQFVEVLTEGVSCMECGDVFENAAILQFHLTYKTAVCGVCREKFCNLSTLGEHYVTAHP